MIRECWLQWSCRTICGLALVAVWALNVQAEESGPRHWSLRPIQRPAVPLVTTVETLAGQTSPIDAFVRVKLLEQGLQPAPPADRATLIRRLTLDLTGLLPTPAEIDAFLADDTADAYERLVDRLLESPAYGEQWGRHWLDVIRYAETEGFEYDRHRAGAWRFRDYVIDSFNADKPYDQFLLEQIAGDELAGLNPVDPPPPADTLSERQRELLVASGFHRLGAVRRNAGNPELAFSRHEVLTEMTDIVGTAVLGLSLGCARCHDHKFDEIPQLDYYRLQAFMAGAQEYDCVLAGNDEQAAWKAKTESIQKEVAELKKSLAELKNSEADQIKSRIEDLQRQLPRPLPTISAVRNVEALRTPVHLLKRGNTDRKEQQVGPQVPTLVSQQPPREYAAEIPAPRTELARWLTDPANPLTARVMVNRIWQRHFGRGIVSTMNDFGMNGSEPTHPELLDWLATEFLSNGWKMKPLHRLIVLSQTYRQAAESATAADPENRWLAHFSRRRLEAEEIRDAMLQVAGRLNSKRYGPSVMVPVDADQVALLYAPAQWTVTADAAEHVRRSIYLIAKRNLRLSFLETFDLPDAQSSCAARESSTHALQTLELLNGAFSNEVAKAFADRLRAEAGLEVSRQITLAWRLAAGRDPTDRETTLARQFLESHPLEEFALAVFNLNAFLYVN